jgi:hypothetical protein
MAICLRWSQIKGADVEAYRVYRSILGFEAPNLQGASIDGLDLVLNINGTGNQTFTFNATDSVVTTINATITDGKAYDSLADETKFLLRSNVRDETGSVEIVGGTALSLLGLTARTITELSEDFQIVSILAPEDPAEIVGYTDLDGVIEDWYALSTMASTGAESRKTDFKQATADSGALCRVEGIVTDLQGARVPDAIIEAKIMDFDQSVVDPAYITKGTITTLSQVDGRWSLPLLQNTLVLLKIDAVGYSENVIIPALAWVDVTDLEVTQAHRWRS